MKKYNIGLIGFGCVGQGFYELLQANPEIPAEVVRIAVKNPTKERPLNKELFVFEYEKLLGDPSIDLVVELIDDAETAFRIVKKALQLGKPVVTANKKMVSENLDALISLQDKYHTPVLYEGAVCGSIPIIQTIDKYYKSDSITSIKGIFNGSTNYILTKIFDTKVSYEEALKGAQDKGFAESDPALDVGGFDPKYKLSILIRHIFGQAVHPDRIINWGIDKLNKEDFEFAKNNNLKIKLLAKAELQNGTLSLIVAPHFVNSKDPLYHIENENNAVIIEGAYAGQQLLTGKGAGSLPTGLAVLSDVQAIIDNATYHYSANSFLMLSDNSVEVYLRYSSQSEFVTELFDNISEKYMGKKSSYVLGSIKLSKLKSIIKMADVNVVIMTSERSELQTAKLSYSYAS
jgi:homoserine dehydrogenase